jgi:4-amino-4-deoxy-L-arabinose transferase-like glycosyltransferase
MNSWKVFLWILGIIVAIRQLMTLFSPSLSHIDVDLYRYAGQLILDGKNPYTEQISMSNHPPGIFISYAILILIFGDSDFSLKIPIYIFTILSGFIVFLICKHLIRMNEEKSNEIIIKQNPDN